MRPNVRKRLADIAKKAVARFVRWLDCKGRTVYKLGREAERRWRRLDGSRLIVKVLRGVRFIDGEEQADDRLAA